MFRIFLKKDSGKLKFFNPLFILEKSEVIFLTHNEKKQEYNLANNIPGEELLWRPDIQENKISSNGQLNIRYEHKLKADYIYQFRALHELLIPWNTIRYIF